MSPQPDTKTTMGHQPHTTGENQREEPLSLYVHIPFCETKCPYCDFNTYANLEALIPSYLKALQRELLFWGTTLRHLWMKTLFFGGGTPSLLTPPQLEALLQTIHDSFRVTPDAEVTLEANPGDLTLDKLTGYRSLEINRLSIGVQSLDDRLLHILGRRHTAEEAITAYEEARQAGFNNVSLDLIYGISHQSLDTWQKTVRQAVALEPDHLSLYALTLESNTPMETWVHQGILPEPDPDLAADMYLHAEEHLAQAGYEHYEISNWAHPGRQSLHNLTYWRNLPYLGVGPGAHSYLGGHRFSVLRSPREYIRHARQLPTKPSTPGERAQQGKPSPLKGEGLGEVEPFTTGTLAILDMVEPIGRDLEMGETMMMGLRLAEGVSDEQFTRRFGISLATRYGPIIEELQELGLLHWQGEALALTPEGYLLGNEVFGRFLVG